LITHESQLLRLAGTTVKLLITKEFAVKKNQVQFQPGMSLREFVTRFGTEEQCREALHQWRWPQGFRCPMCEGERFVQLKSRPLLQCVSCHHQSSLTSGTIFAGTKLSLRVWFMAIHLISQAKTGLSALALKRQLGVSYNTAWLLKHKLMQSMKERDDHQPLGGYVQIDDAVWGGEGRGGKRGRNAPRKISFVAAVACDEKGHPLRLRLSRLPNVRQRTIARWARRHLQPDTHVVSDGLSGFLALPWAGCVHEKIVTGGGYASATHPRFKWVNTIIGNVKNSLRGAYHAVGRKHLPRYLAEFSYRFNRRFDLPELLPRLGRAAARTPPLPYRLAKLAEAHW
jgi:transposase-like protein